MWGKPTIFSSKRFSAEGEYIDALGSTSLDENLYRTAGVAVDSEAGVAYVSRSVSHQVQAFDITHSPPRLLWEMGGAPGAGPGDFNGPGGMTIVDDRLYIADTRNHRVQVIQIR